MKLELLPNELLLNLFEYLTIFHVFQAFDNINIRFRTLILIYCQKIHLDFQSISKTNFDIICKKYLPLFNHQILSLRLSDDDNTPQQISLFLSYGLRLEQFTHLQTISLSHIHSSSILNKLLTDCLYLPSLTHFTLTNCHISIDQISTDHLYNQIWSLPKLTYCYVDINFSDRSYFPKPTIISTSLKSLHIPNISCDFNELIHLFQVTPNLQYLSIVFVDYTDEYDLSLFYAPITRLKLSFDCSLNILQYFLQNLSNLQHLTLETSNIYMNGYEWEDFICKYLPKLKIFQFKMRFSPLINQNKLIELNEILDSFRTKFWIDEHQWFVRCHWYASDEQYHLNFIDLFTLPYIFKEFLSYTGCILAKSTCPNDDMHWSYNHVNQLCYRSSNFTNPIMSRIHFSNIQHLSLSLLFNDQFLSIVSNLERLTSLSVSINNNNKTIENIQSQLQLLLDRAIHLNSISFGSWRSTSLQVLLMNIFSQSIHKVNFQGFICDRNSRCFDDKQCIQLIHSSLGKQCKILLIKVKTRMNIVNL
ncbi:unnamed protein product, partial [Adineta steineri]